MVNPSRMDGRLLLIVRATAALAIVVGLISLIGWWLLDPAIIQVHRAMFATPHNAAIGILLSGVALILILVHRPRAAAACGIATATIGILTLGQYLFDIDLHVDQLLYKHPAGEGYSMPGRMPPHAAACLIFLGSALILQRFPKRFTQRPVTLVLIGAAASAIGLIAMTARLRGHDNPVGPGSFGSLAPSASVAFLLLGAGISSCGWTSRKPEEFEIHQLRSSVLLYATFGMAMMVIVSVLLTLLVSIDPEDMSAGLSNRMIVLFGTSIVLAMFGSLGIYLLVQPLTEGIVVKAGTLEKQVREATGTLKSELQEYKRLDAALASQAGRLDRANAELKQSRERTAEQARELERLNQELGRSNQELQQFAYVASHDLQEPLRMVASYVQLIERRYKDKLDTDAVEFINFAVDGAKRMQTLINDLLAYSRVSTQGEAMGQTDVNEAIDRALANLQARITDTGATIRRAGEMPTFKADSGQLARLFQNLVGNALKFCQDRSPVVEISVEGQDEHWRFAIRDNGIGIDPKYADRIFIIFQRLHTRTEYDGTGIGLAVCKRIVERHGGLIWFDSTPGEGTTFYFTISRTQEAD